MVASAVLLLLTALIGVAHFSAKADDSPRANAGPDAGTKSGAPAQRSSTETVELSDAQLGMISIGGAGTFDGIVLSGIVAAYLA